MWSGRGTERPQPRQPQQVRGLDLVMCSGRHCHQCVESVSRTGWSSALSPGLGLVLCSAALLAGSTGRTFLPGLAQSATSRRSAPHHGESSHSFLEAPRNPD